jgi:ABC-2 type transport system ATP-binding protein
MIGIHKLSKHYRDVLALDALSIQIAKGEVVGLVGKNGAGKSTALRIISGQLLPSSGDVKVDGYSVTEDPLEVRRRIGYLPDVPPLYPEMTARGYLEFAARLRGVAANQVSRRVESVISRTGLAPVAERPLLGLSRGFQQRAGIAQALVHNPPVLLFDEPMAGLDPLQIVQIRELIRSLKTDHTILFSSHILAEIANVCDRIMLIDAGQVKAVGSEEELRKANAGGLAYALTVRGTRAALARALDKIAGLRWEFAAGEEKGTVTAHLAAAKGDPRERISRACAEAELDLLELRPEGQDLEALFMALLGDEPAKKARGGAA